MADGTRLRGNRGTATRAPRPGSPQDAPAGISRRHFIGYLIAGPTLIAAAPQFISPDAAQAAIPTHQPVDSYDLSDLLNEAAAPTASLIKVVVNKDGTVSFALPRAEVGQGITTACAMTIADEMDLALDKVKVTLADAQPELIWNQFTGGSNTMHSIYFPLRTAAAIARGKLLDAAANVLQQPVDDVSILDGVISAPDGKSVTFASLAGKAAVKHNRRVVTQLKPAASQKLVGSPQRRIDAHEIVTGKKQFAMDLNVPGALPTMVCRPPTINGSVKSINNLAAVKAMDGITDVVAIPHTAFVPGGVAVRGHTFGQCIDAIRALEVSWSPGSVDGLSESDVKAQLAKSELKLTPSLNPLAKTIEETFTFNFRPGDPLEPNCAVANVTSSAAEVWASLKSPIWAKEQLVTILGLPLDAITVHVAQGGGSFGRHLFSDSAFEAAVISQKLGKPVKLMWARTDSFRQGRCHPMATSKIRVTYVGSNILTLEQRHTSVATDFSMGFGELLSATAATPPDFNQGYSQLVFELTANCPYNFGLVTQLINEAYQYNTFNTGSVRNIYSPDVCTALELMVDKTAVAVGQDPYAFRKSFVRDPRLLAVLNKVAQVGDWGRKMGPGTAQGIAMHSEYKGAAACLVEIDCTPATVNRSVPNGFTGPRVTKVVYAIDVGLPINPLGLEAQMQGGIMDGIAQALTFSLHLKDGHFLEGSWDNAYYTRQWNVPPEIKVIVMPATTGKPGGAGEFGVAASMAATACAYARATGKLPTTFPINHDQPLGFTPYPTVPPIPQSPTNGLNG